MARIVGGIGSSHVPSIGKAYDMGQQDEPDWKPLFDAYKPVQRWLAELKPDVAIVVYNDHGASVFFDKYPTFAIGAADQYAIGEGRIFVEEEIAARSLLEDYWMNHPNFRRRVRFFLRNLEKTGVRGMTAEDRRAIIQLMAPFLTREPVRTVNRMKPRKLAQWYMIIEWWHMMLRKSSDDD